MEEAKAKESPLYNGVHRYTEAIIDPLNGEYIRRRIVILPGETEDQAIRRVALATSCVPKTEPYEGHPLDIINNPER
jgi:hypothetical protein